MIPLTCVTQNRQIIRKANKIEITRSYKEGLLFNNIVIYIKREKNNEGDSYVNTEIIFKELDKYANEGKSHQPCDKNYFSLAVSRLKRANQEKESCS